MRVVEPSDDARRSSPSALRNRGPILEVLRRVLPERGLVLTIAEGTGEHVTHFAPALPSLEWQPSDRDPEALASIAAYLQHGVPNVRSPIALDARDETWPIARADAITCINMVHIAPWEATEGLVRGAARVLDREGAPLVLYGPYRIGGEHTAPSNVEFDGWLKSRDPRFGVRDLERVLELAAAEGFGHDETVAMPANNFVVVLRKTTGSA